MCELKIAQPYLRIRALVGKAQYVRLPNEEISELSE